MYTRKMKKEHKVIYISGVESMGDFHSLKKLTKKHKSLNVKIVYLFIFFFKVVTDPEETVAGKRRAVTEIFRGEL